MIRNGFAVHFHAAVLPVMLSFALMGMTDSPAQVVNSGQAISGALAADSETGFVVQVSIFADGTSDPVSKHKIVFAQNKICDFDLLSPRFIMVIDPARKSVVKLDRKTSVKSTLSAEELVKRTAQAKTAETDPAIRKRIGLDIGATEAADGVYSIEFSGVEYRTTTRKVSRAEAQAFGQFADWAMRLNIVTGSPIPPFARMTLNRALADADRIPDTLNVTAAKQKYRCKHDMSQKLSAEERNSVTEIDSFLALYREVGLKDFPVQ